MRDILTALEVDVEIGNLEEEEEKRKASYQLLKDIPKNNLLEETAKVDKLLYKFRTHSIAKTDALFYAGAVVVAKRLDVKVNMAAERKEPMLERRLQNKNKELKEGLKSVRIIKG